jgi:glycerol dehydrogenase
MIRTIGFPGRYIQGPKALACLAGLLKELGVSKPVTVADAIVAERILPGTLALLEENGFAVGQLAFPGECTAENIARMAGQAQQYAPDAIIALGGGKAIDAAKGVARRLGVALIVCPTIASNDAPTSRLIVLYDDQHRVAGVDYMTRNPDAVVVDTDIIVQAPARFFAAGIGDAISKKFEARQCSLAQGMNSYGTPPLNTALVLADMAYSTIVEFGVSAYRAVAEHRLTPEVERVIEGTVLLSGIGFESGGLSLAHALIRGLTAIPAMASQLHGELVAFGTLVQLVVEQRAPAEVDELIDVLCGVDLPVSFAQLGMPGPPGRDELDVIVDLTLKAAYSRHMAPPLTAATLASALAEADRLGRAALDQRWSARS